MMISHCNYNNIHRPYNSISFFSCIEIVIIQKKKKKKKKKEISKIESFIIKLFAVIFHV